MATKAQSLGGKYRQKRGDTLIGTIERTYKVDFGVRGDTKLSSFLKKEGLPSLSKALRAVASQTNREK